MGEYAEMILDGLIDEYTGEVIDGNITGYPRSKEKSKKHNKQKCQKCGRSFATGQALEDHTRDKHKQ